MGLKEPGDLVLLIRRDMDEYIDDILARLQACSLNVHVFPLDDLKVNAQKAAAELVCRSCCPTGRCCFCLCRCTRVCCESCGTADTPLENLLRGSCITQHGMATSDIGTAIFVSATLDVLNLLQQELHDDRLREQTSVINHIYVRHTHFSAAERSQLLQRIVERPVQFGGAGLRASPPNQMPTEKQTALMAFPMHPAIEVITTLHDPHFVHELFRPLPKYAALHGYGPDGTAPLLYEDASYSLRWKVWLEHFFHGGILIETLRPETRDKLTCPEQIHPNQYFIHELRANYGEETAWFFAFNYHLVRMLYIPAAVGMVISVVVPLIAGPPDKQSSGKGISAALTLGFGIFVSIIWGTVVMIHWSRRTAEYNFQWHGHVDGFVEASYPNPDYVFEKAKMKAAEQGDVTDQTNEAHDFVHGGEDITQMTSSKRTCAFMWRYLVVAIFGVVWVLLFSHAVAWYVALRARHIGLAWVALLITKDGIHGILMAGLGAAIFKGVIGGLMSLENYRTEKERRREETCTMCTIEWWNFFVGLLILAFVFIPLVDSGLFADSLVREGSVLNTFFKSVMANQDPTNATLWPASFVNLPPAGVYQNNTGVVVFHPHSRARNHMQRSLLKENIRLILIGPVIVARILITVVGTIVPFCLQTRRREEMQATLKAKRSKFGGGITKFSGGIRKMFTQEKGKMRKKSRDTRNNLASVVPVSPGSRIHEEKQHADMPGSSLYDTAMNDPVQLTAITGACILVQANFRGLSARKKMSSRKMALKKADALVEEAGLVQWDPFILFNDLNIQFTLVLFFSSVATWIPFAVLLANCVEVRLRCATLAYSSRPPPIRSASGIGTWSKVMLMGTWIAVAVNCAMLIIPTATLEGVSGCKNQDMHWRLDTSQLSFLMKYVNLGASGNLVNLFSGSGLPGDNQTQFFEVDAFLGEQRRLMEGRQTPCVSNTLRFSFYAGAVGLCAAIKGLLHFSLPTVPEWIHRKARQIRLEGRKKF